MFSPESQTVEFKGSLNLWREVVESCAAFATAQGGTIFVGVADDGRVTGVQTGSGTLEDLANKIAQNTTPRIVPDITTRSEQGRTVIVVEVQEHQTKPVTAFGRPYRRSGRTNQVLPASAVAELYLASRGLTWDETAKAEAGPGEIDPEKVQKFLSRAMAERRWEIDPRTPSREAINQLNLLRAGQMTIAAILLFGRNPQRFLAQASLRCARFKGNSEVEFLDMRALEGDIVSQVEDAMAFIGRNIRMAAKIEGQLERKEQWDYPLDAVREGITNAVCHRDYADSGNVLVKIFDDRLEIWNPGGLPDGLTVEDLKRSHESKPRNKLIARSFFLIKYIEQFGTGTGRMIDQCRKAGAPEPEFESRAGAFRIVFPRTFSAERRFGHLGLKDGQTQALQRVLERGKISRVEYELIARIKSAAAKREIGDLLKKRILVKRGSGTRFWYELAKGPREDDPPESGTADSAGTR